MRFKTLNDKCCVYAKLQTAICFVLIKREGGWGEREGGEGREGGRLGERREGGEGGRGSQEGGGEGGRDDLYIY